MSLLQFFPYLIPVSYHPDILPLLNRPRRGSHIPYRKDSRIPRSQHIALIAVPNIPDLFGCKLRFFQCQFKDPSIPAVGFPGAAAFQNTSSICSGKRESSIPRDSYK